MSLREQIRRHRKDSRLILGGLSLALLFFTAIYYLILSSRELPAAVVTNRVLLFSLRNINAVLVLTILFVLVRNLFKLWVERQNRILGSKFKTKLVATYIGLSLIPVILLFLYATELLQGSFENLFEQPTDDLLVQGNAVAQALTVSIQESNGRDAARVAMEIEAIDLQDLQERPRLRRTLQKLLGELDLDLLAVYEDTEFIQGVLNPQTGFADFPEADRAFLLKAVREGEASRVLEPPGYEGRVILAAVASPGSTQDAAQPRTVVVAGSFLEPLLAQQTEALVQAYQSRRQLEVQRPDLETSYLLLFLMVTLVILLISSWMGLYLARRVTVPIQALADGTRRIMGGDLQHRVEAAADDELGTLVDSFNRMTQELEKNKALLEKSNQDLVTTNRRLAEERALMGAVLQNLAAGVISIDGNGKVLTCNGAALEMLQQREVDVLGQTLDTAWHDSERGKLLSLFDDELALRGRTWKEVRLTLEGEWKTFEAKITTMHDDAGAVIGHVLVLEDLTELIKAQKLATWNEAARRIAHEIKNPLTPIKLSAERLLMKYHQGDPQLGKALEEGVAIIVREVGSMKSMVDEFSQFARMPRPQPTEIDVERLVNETIHLYRGIKPGVEIHAQLKAPLQDVRLDGEQLRSALINLLDNAVAATSAPGEVKVSVHKDNGELKIQVADTGSGIPREAREKLFLPYFSTKGRGTGLGLAIVHRIVTDHHGTIRAEDNHPRGTVFTLEFPQV